MVALGIGRLRKLFEGTVQTDFYNADRNYSLSFKSTSGYKERVYCYLIELLIKPDCNRLLPLGAIKCRRVMEILIKSLQVLSIRDGHVSLMFEWHTPFTV